MSAGVYGVDRLPDTFEHAFSCAKTALQLAKRHDHDDCAVYGQD